MGGGPCHLHPDCMLYCGRKAWRIDTAASTVVKDVKTNRQRERMRGIPVMDQGWKDVGEEAAADRGVT